MKQWVENDSSYGRKLSEQIKGLQFNYTLRGVTSEGIVMCTEMCINVSQYVALLK